MKLALSHLQQGDAEKGANELLFALEESGKLLHQSELSIHAYKVKAGVTRPRTLEHHINLAGLTEKVHELANTRWQRLHETRPAIEIASPDTTTTAELTLASTMGAIYDPVYLEYVLNELLLNSYKHSDRQTAPSLELNLSVRQNDIVLIVSNALKPSVTIRKQSKSRLGLTSLADAASAYGFSLPSHDLLPEEQRFVARVPIARLRLNGERG